MAQIVSDGSVEQADCEKASGTFGWVARLGSTECEWCDYTPAAAGMGLVEGHWTTMTSTRTEARGLLDSMRASRRWIEDGLTPNLKHIQHALDNSAVVDLYATIGDRSSLEWLRAKDKDVWYEIQVEKNWWETRGSYSVSWIRSHPEKRLSFAVWDGLSIMNHAADRWAWKAQRIAERDYITADEQMAGTFYDEHAWSLWHSGTAYVGDVRKSVRDTLRWSHLLEFIRTSSVMSEIGPSHVDIPVMKKLSKPPKGEHPITYGVMAAKLLGGILATETVLTQRSQDKSNPNAALCTLCGTANENNYHMLCECVGCPEVVKARREWITTVHDKLESIITAKNSTDLHTLSLIRALQELWQLDAAGRLIAWTGGTDLTASMLPQLLGFGCTDYDAAEAITWSTHLTVACTAVDDLLRNQGSVDKVACGCFTRDWRRLLENKVGMQPNSAMKFLSSIGKLMRTGTTAVWKARCDTKSKLDHIVQNTHHTRLKAVIENQKQKAAANGDTVPEGLISYVYSLSVSEQRKWMASVNKKKSPATCLWGNKTQAELQHEAEVRNRVRQQYEDAADLENESDGNDTDREQTPERPRRARHRPETPQSSAPPQSQSAPPTPTAQTTFSLFPPMSPTVSSTCSSPNCTPQPTRNRKRPLLTSPSEHRESPARQKTRRTSAPQASLSPADDPPLPPGPSKKRPRADPTLHDPKSKNSPQAHRKPLSTPDKSPNPRPTCSSRIHADALRDWQPAFLRDTAFIEIEEMDFDDWQVQPPRQRNQLDTDTDDDTANLNRTTMRNPD
jgi:hypothetical protein